MRSEGGEDQLVWNNNVNKFSLQFHNISLSILMEILNTSCHRLKFLCMKLIPILKETVAVDEKNRKGEGTSLKARDQYTITEH